VIEMSAALSTYTPGIRRRMRADERRLQLLEAGRRVIAEDGLAGLTMESLAISAGVSRALVYQHFADRESLLLALLEAEWEWLDERIVPALASTDDLAERAAAVIRPYFDAKSERGPVFAALLLWPQVDTPAVNEAMHDYLRRTTRYWAREVRERFGLDEQTARAFIAVITGAFEGAARQWWFSERPGRAALENAYLDVVRATIAYAAAPASATPALLRNAGSARRAGLAARRG
jgi:AcrR family transcriptional regulator